MSLHLTAGDMTRYEAVSRTMLAAPAATSADVWQREVMRTMRDLLHADSALFGVPGARDPFVTDGVDATTLERWHHYTRHAIEVEPDSPDPLLPRFTRNRRACGVEVVDHRVVDDLVGGAWQRSVFHNEVEIPGGLLDVRAMQVTLPQGEDAALALYYNDTGPKPFGDHALTLLRALLPSFKAGLDTLTRLRAHRTALDAITEPVILFGHDGRELFRNPALERLLDGEPERERLLFEARHLARPLYAMAFPLASRRNETPFPSPQRTVQTAQKRYALRGALVHSGGFGSEECVLVSITVDGGAPTLPSADELRERHGLTRREAEVALLLAEGLPNEAVAEKLFISPHTARRHTEQVLGKLGLNSRKALALKLMQG